MPIRLLPEDVASRIAAGEVVERPASVVKELLENSLDAGATRVEIETRDGGAKLVRVRDNGTGIASDDVALAFRRHATSKLETSADLEHIGTLGFRGEALSSIAAVSRLTCITRQRDEPIGTQIRLEGGEIVAERPTGRPPGTEIVVEDLFYNVPARRKFLRTERTERRHIDSFATRYAIAYPNTAFSLVHDGREALTTPGTGDAKEVLISVYGLDLGSSLLEIPPSLTEGHTIRVSGFVGPTTVHRANRGYITLFVNGRWIEDIRLSYAIIQAYHTLLPVKRYPVAFVMVEMPPEDVDVNVHPTKAEVRFRDGDAAFRAVQRAVRATVISKAPASAEWSSDARAADQLTDAQLDQRRRLAQLTPAQQQRINLSALTPARSDTSPTRIGTDSETISNGPASQGPAGPTRGGDDATGLPPLRIVGQLATMFIITEGPDGLYLVDQHAAHERVLYEELVADKVQGQIPRQPLLEPVSVSLPLDEADSLEEVLPTLQALGLEVDPFGPGTFLVRAVPAPLQTQSPEDLLADIASAAAGVGASSEQPFDVETSGASSPILAELEEMVIRHICKRAAVKAGQVLSHEEMARLVKDLEQTRNPRTCPHGRPTVVKISTEELARHFGRGGSL
ncbi:MAG: DNA mismatch repair endonuclease MutL [Anaerolineae bacterium]